MKEQKIQADVYKPTKEDLLRAKGKSTPDIIKQHLKVLFCGINPGLYSAAVGHHFGRPGNRFWKGLYEGGFTPRLFHSSEQEKLLDLGYGITNFVKKATAQASELSKEEIIEGGKRVGETVKKYQPKVLAILGIQAYRVAFQEPKARPGLQQRKIEDTFIWVLPNPSGLNAHFQSQHFAEMFGELKRFSEGL